MSLPLRDMHGSPCSIQLSMQHLLVESYATCGVGERTAVVCGFGRGHGKTYHRHQRLLGSYVQHRFLARRRRSFVRGLLLQLKAFVGCFSRVDANLFYPAILLQMAHW